jgi:hypothetical protein
MHFGLTRLNDMSRFGDLRLFGISRPELGESGFESTLELFQNRSHIFGNERPVWLVDGGHCGLTAD